jgi:hypothetical protein
MSQFSHIQSQPHLNAATLKVRDIIVSRANHLEKDISNRKKSIAAITTHLSENTVSQDLRIKFASFQLPKSISEDEKQKFIEADEALNRKFQREKMELRLQLLSHHSIKLEENLEALTLGPSGAIFAEQIQSLLPPDVLITAFDLTLLRKSVLDVMSAQKIQKHQNKVIPPPLAQTPLRPMAVDEDPRMLALEKQVKELQISLNRYRSSGDQPTSGPHPPRKIRPIQDTKKRNEDRGRSASPRRQKSSASRSSLHRPRSQSKGRSEIERGRGRENQEKESQRHQQNRRGKSNESRNRF